MSIETLKNALPEEAKDLRLNLGSVLAGGPLTPAQSWGVALATALAVGEPQTIRAIAADAAAQATPEVTRAAKIAASLMAMNNIYYRFVHLVPAADYKTLPAKLRMTAMAKPGVDKVDFELWSLVVSAVNGCGMCLEAHEKVLRDHGLSAEQVQAGVRIAATVHAAARTLAAEEALTPLLAQAA
jgi:alkyl hydroperoxide reductase subunit D